MKSIPFKPWKAKAISESSPEFEWQTRRLRGLEEINKEPDKWHIKTYPDNSWLFQSNVCDLLDVSPCYQVGDIVYIKEAWAVDKQYDHLKPSEIPRDIRRYFKDSPLLRYGFAGRWRSPMFMPAWAARYFIKITGVRYARLQDMTEEDAAAEGTKVWLESHPEVLDDAPFSAKQCFALLWDTINPQHPWSLDEWVSVYSFVRVEQPK